MRSILPTLDACTGFSDVIHSKLRNLLLLKLSLFLLGVAPGGAGNALGGAHAANPNQGN